MTTMEAPAEAAEPLSAPGSSPWSAPFWAHLLVLFVVLLGVGAATTTGDSFVTDDGSYELQLRALDQGSWVWASGTEQYDETSTHYPVAFATPTSDGWVPLAKHPAWPWLAHQVSPITGIDHAYAALGLLSVLLAASAAWLLAGEHHPDWRRTAFWLTGLAPVVVTFAVGWAHAAAAAAGAVALLGAVRLVARGARPSTVALLAAGLAAGILVRTEGLLVAIALAMAIVVAGRFARRGWGWSLGWGAAVAVYAAVVVKLEAIWIHSITGGGTFTFEARENGGTAGSGFIENRFLAAIRSLVEATDAIPRPLLVIAIVAAALASLMVAHQRRRWFPIWQVAAVATVLLLALRVVADPNIAVTGLLSAWPVMVVGVAAAVAVAWRRLPVEAFTTVLFVGAILATQYPDGGAGQWGGRFYAPVTAGLAVLAALGVHRLLDAIGEPGSAERSRARTVLVALAVAPLLLGTLSIHSARSASETLFDQVDAQVDGVAITPISQLPRMMWRHDLPWMVVADDDDGDDLTSLLTSMGEGSSPEEVSLVLRSTDLADADQAIDRAGGWTEVDRRPAGVLTVVVLHR